MKTVKIPLTRAAGVSIEFRLSSIVKESTSHRFHSLNRILTGERLTRLTPLANYRLCIRVKRILKAKETLNGV